MTARFLVAVLVIATCPIELQADASRVTGAHQPVPGGTEQLNPDMPAELPQPCDRRARLPFDAGAGGDTLASALLAEAALSSEDSQTAGQPVDSTGSELIASIATHPLTPVDLDADHDGVLDSDDLCPGTLMGLDVDRSGCLIMTQLRRRLVLHVSYVPGTTAPDPTSLRVLDDLASRLRRATTLRVLVEGFTDNVGDEQANLRVSQKRANRIRDYLARQGVPVDRVEAVGRGEDRFIASNDTAGGRQKNRRIEISYHRD